jgi:protein-S-isoprenylcysteine O-methyltransferase Ste14
VRINLTQLATQGLMTFLVFALALFVPAGSIAWAAAWVYLIMFFGFVTALTVWLLRRNPALLEERMAGRRKPNQQAWDKLLMAVAGACFVAWFVLMALDARRFSWSAMPVWWQVVGAAILLSSFYVFFVTFRENPYLSPVVRVQRERGQSVISTGPYRHVRHPMYAGSVLFVIGTTLLLGSWYGFTLAAVLVALVVVRAVLEERTLLKELAGYAAYMARVRYRLIPGIW